MCDAPATGELLTRLTAVEAELTQANSLIVALQAENAELRRQLSGFPELQQTAEHRLAVRQAGTEVVAPQDRSSAGWAAGPPRADAASGR